MDEYKKLNQKRIGFAVTGSFCTLAETMKVLENITKIGAEITPILSFNVASLDTKFGTAEHWKNEINRITDSQIIDSIPKAEPIGPKALLDALIVLPCSGNTLGKLANGITDTPVCMAVKAHLRNNRPVLIGVSTNDGLGVSAANIGRLLNNKNIFFVPFGQDSPHKKHNSLVCDFELTMPALVMAMEGKQLQPLLREYK